MKQFLKHGLWLLIFSGMLVTAISAAAETLGLWLLDEGVEDTSAMILLDSSGNGAHAIRREEPWQVKWVPGKFGTGLQDDGSNLRQFIQINYHPALDISDSFTIECWINFNGTWDQGDIIDRGWNTFGESFLLATSGNPNDTGISLRGFINTGSGRKRIWGTTIIPKTGWHHVAFSYNPSLPSGNLKLYVDAQEDTLDPASDPDYQGPIRSTQVTTWVLDGSSNGNLIASVDEIRFSNEALDPSQLGYWGSIPPDPSVFGTPVQLGDGWTLFGSGRKGIIPWDDCLIMKDSNFYSLTDAEDSGWIQSTVYSYGILGDRYGMVPGDDLYLRWKFGYWIWSAEPNLQLIIPYSRP